MLSYFLLPRRTKPGPRTHHLAFTNRTSSRYTALMPRHPINIRSGTMSALSPALNEYLADGGMLERGKSALAAEIWPQIVGHWYARHSCVIALKKKELQVYCDTPTLAQQLQFDQETIIERLNERLGGKYVTSLRPASVGPRQQRETVRGHRELESQTPEEAELAQVLLPEEELVAIRERAAVVEDEELRTRFIAFAERVARLDEWKRLRGWRQCPECGARHEDLTDLCFACRVMRKQPYLE